jgi:DNA polymerase-3 subunit epsilon
MTTTSNKTKGIATFDLETTGVDTAKDRIVQIAVVLRKHDGTLIDEKQVMVNPTIPIPKEASDVHGITDQMVSACPTFNRIAKSLNAYMEGYDLSGYNIINYDIPLLVEEFLRAGVEPNFKDVLFLDVIDIYKHLNPRTLEACYNQYTGKTLVDAHEALADTRATIEAFDKMMETEESLKGLSIKELSELAEYRTEIVDYSGKFTRNEAGNICFNFGKSKGVEVTKNLGFLDWMLDKDFTEDTKNWARKLKAGEVE